MTVYIWGEKSWQMQLDTAKQIPVKKKKGSPSQSHTSLFIAHSDIFTTPPPTMKFSLHILPRNGQLQRREGGRNGERTSWLMTQKKSWGSAGVRRVHEGRLWVFLLMFPVFSPRSSAGAWPDRCWPARGSARGRSRCFEITGVPFLLQGTLQVGGGFAGGSVQWMLGFEQCRFWLAGPAV